MVMIELEAQERTPAAAQPRGPRPAAVFSAPFSTPTLQWARRKRLRCSNALLDPSRRLLNSPSPDRPQPPAESSAINPSPSSDWQKPPIRPRTPRKDEGFEEEDDEEDEEAAEDVDEHQGRAKRPDGAKPPPGDVGAEGRFLRSRASAEFGGRKKKKKVELWISLSREEIEEDYYSITGCKLPRRPKRRPRNAPANLSLRIFPGSWLPNTITAEMYKVHEPSEPRRR